MKNKKSIIVALLLLCLLMIGAVNAASDTEDIINSDATKTEITQTHTDTGEKTITSTDNTENNGLKKTEKTETTTPKTSAKNENILKEDSPKEIKNWTALHTAINEMGTGDEEQFTLTGNDDDYKVTSTINIGLK